MKKKFVSFGNLMTTGQLAKAAGVPRSTVQHYLNEGLIKPVETTDAGYQLFDDKSIKKIKKIRSMRPSLKDIKKKL